MKILLLLFISLLLPLAAQDGDPFAGDAFENNYGPLSYCPPKHIEILYQAYDVDLGAAAEILESRPAKFNGNDLLTHLKTLAKPDRLAQMCARPGETVNLSNAKEAKTKKEEQSSNPGLHLEFEPSLGNIDYVADVRIILKQTDTLKNSGISYSQKISNSMSVPLGEFMLIGVTTPAIDGKIAHDKRRFHLIRLQFDQTLVDHGEAQYELLKKAFREALEESQKQR